MGTLHVIRYTAGQIRVWTTYEWETKWNLVLLKWKIWSINASLGKDSHLTVELERINSDEYVSKSSSGYSNISEEPT